MKNDEVQDIRGLSNILGLSASTVSRVLNGKGANYRISKSTQQRVIETAKKYNYKPNRLARGLKMEKTESIGLIIPDISNPYFADIAKSVEYASRNKGYTVILCDSNEQLTVEKELIMLLSSQKVDGIIMAPVGTAYDHLLLLYNSGMPMVLIDRFFKDIPLPYVASDNYQGSFQAVQYLIKEGHMRIACILGNPESVTTQERNKGFYDAMQKNGLTVNESFVLGDDYTIENGYQQTKKLLSYKTRPTAIFALSNQISFGVIKAIRESGLKIPDDISIVSFDEQSYSAFLDSPMTTVEQMKNEMGRLSVDLLVKQIENRIQKNPVEIILKTKLNVRESVRTLNL